LRDDATGRVVAGGTVVDPFPPARRVARDRRIAALQAWRRDDVDAVLDELLAVEGWVDLGRFRIARNLDSVEGLGRGQRIGRADRPVLVSAETAAAVAGALVGAIGAWHERHPELPGLAKAALLTAAKTWPADIVEAELLECLRRGDIAQRDAIYCLPGHEAVLAPADAAAWRRIEAAIAADPLRPPRVREVAELLSVAPEDADALLRRLERFGILLRVAPNRFFPPSSVVALGEIAADMAVAAEEGTFTAAQYKDRSGIGRNLTIQVLEYLDKIGVTKRVGEHRYLLRSAAEVLGHSP
jgi:selenocysteine-specific elongation factor